MTYSRENFRNEVFTRDKHTCVVPGCGKPAVDAHHIIERALWKEESELGGYFPENGASVCEEHHKLAERDIITPDALRRWCGSKTVLPKGFDPVGQYTKWGVDIASGKLTLKYPSTPFLDISPTQDNTFIFSDYEEWVDVPLVITAKMDGANVKLTRDLVASRNGTHATKTQFDHLKALHQQFRWSIPEGITIFGEWLKEVHTIQYEKVQPLLQIFAVVKNNEWLSWNDTKLVAEEMGYPTTPEITTIQCSEAWELPIALNKHASAVVKDGHEGIVVRSAHSFYIAQFEKRVAKYVRKGFRQKEEEE